MAVIGLTLLIAVTLCIAGGLHWKFGRWWLSLSVPVVAYALFVLFIEYVVADHGGGASFTLVYAAINGLPGVLLGSLLGALVARSLKAAREEDAL
jgi:hypothetical protein